MKIINATFSVLIALTVSRTSAADITYDTTRYSANNEIYSITKYEDLRLAQYNEFYSNGKDKYFVIYYYENDTLRSETVHKPDGAEYAHGNYSYYDDGYIYDYFNSSGDKLSSSSYSLFGYLVRYDKKAPDGTSYWYTNYSYDDVGWLLKEEYFNSAGELDAQGDWSYDSLSGITQYHYTLHGDSLLVNQYTGDLYDEYITYYGNSLTMKDSTVVFYKDERMYSSLFVWDDNGYMTSDIHYGATGELTSQGSYTFNNSDFTTLYEYTYLSDSTVWKTYSDYRGLVEKTDVYYGEKVYSNTQYRYNDLLYVDSVLYYGDSENLLAFDKYSYYEPFEWVKSYLYAGPSGDTISYYEYAMDGTVTESVGISDTHVLKQGLTLNIKQESNALIINGLSGRRGEFRLFTINGRVVYSGELNGSDVAEISTEGFAKGYYLLTVKNSGFKQVLPVIVH